MIIEENIIKVTERLYDESADLWVRKSPKSFSDFIARPQALSACLPINDMVCLDLGCGEGYFSRLLATNGAKKVSGMDLSSEMIKRAIDIENMDTLGIQYCVGDITTPLPFESSSIDLVTAVFVFNYLTIEDTEKALINIRRVLRPNGHLLFVIPHPFLLCTWKHSTPFYFKVDETNYYSDRNKTFEGKILTIDEKCFDVLNCHKTIEDYITALKKVGLDKIETFKELTVTEEHLKQNPKFLKGTLNQPFFLLIKVGITRE